MLRVFAGPAESFATESLEFLVENNQGWVTGFRSTQKAWLLRGWRNTLDFRSYVVRMYEMELTVREAAARLGVTPGRIRQLVMDGRIKPRYLNPRMMLIDDRELTKPTITDRPRAAKLTKKKGKGAK
jgi:hypothetical protein